MSKQLRVLQGLHRGAEVALESGVEYIVGSDESCTIVLCDQSVAPRHCVIRLDDFGITCRALDRSLWLGERTLKPGEVASLNDYCVVVCGNAALCVGAADPSAQRKWMQVEESLEESGAARWGATRALKRWNPYALFGAVLAGLGGLISIAYATLSTGAEEISPSRVEAARQWLKSISPSGSELYIGLDTEQTLLLSGYVPLNYQREAVISAARKSTFKPRVEVHATEQMTASLSRLVQLEGLSCLPIYRTAGQVACAENVPSEAIANRLRHIAREVPGLSLLDVTVKAPAVQAAAPPPPPAPTHPVVTRKFSVLMYRKGRFLVGPYGERYSEGETFDGLKISQINVDEVVFEHEGRRYPFRVAALGASR